MNIYSSIFSEYIILHCIRYTRGDFSRSNPWVIKLVRSYLFLGLLDSILLLLRKIPTIEQT